MQVTETATCKLCWDRGMPGGCIACGMDSLEHGAEKVASLDPVLLQQYQIPERYLYTEWDEEQLLLSHENMKDNSIFINYCKTLTNYVGRLRSGDMPKSSLIICSDRGFGKRTFVYSCMKECIKYGRKIVPIIDTTEYRRLIILSTEKIYSKSLNKLSCTLEEVNTCDILFLTVDLANYKNCLKTVESVCERRSRMGKPTIITSRYSIKEMSLLDYYGDSEGFVNRKDTVDMYKFPRMIVCWEERKGI